MVFSTDPAAIAKAQKSVTSNQVKTDACRGLRRFNKALAYFRNQARHGMSVLIILRFEQTDNARCRGSA